MEKDLVPAYEINILDDFRIDFKLWLFWCNSIGLWSMINYKLWRYMKNREYYCQIRDGYPLWSWFLCFFTTGIIIPINFAFMLCGMNYTLLEKIYNEPDTEPDLYTTFWIIQINAVVVGAFIKDFVILELDRDMVVHHITTIICCNIQLFRPQLMHYMAIVTVIAELGSACYSYNYISNGSMQGGLVYVFGMTVSNYIILLILWNHFHNSNINICIRFILYGLGVILLFIRYFGMFVFIQDKINYKEIRLTQ